jgi:Mce-associated membrane protein
MSTMSTVTDPARQDPARTTEPDRPAPPDHAAPAGRSGAALWRTPLAALLALVCLACAGVLAWLLSTSGPTSSLGLDAPEEREEVMSLTDQFVKRLGTYSPEMVDGSGQMPDYRDQVREVITPKFAADFDKQVATAEQLVAQAGITRSTEVFATAVSSIDDDSARALVAGAFSDSYTQGTGKDQRTTPQEPLPFRFTVDLVKIDGEWLVDDFTPVGGTPASGPADGSTGGAP